MPQNLLESLKGQRIVVTGAAGQIGEYLCALLEAYEAEVLRLGHHPGAQLHSAMDLGLAESVRKAVVRARPQVVIHTAAYTDVDGAERDPELAMAVNGEGTAHVAAAAKEAGAYLIGIGSDFVFPGDGGAPYREGDPTGPINAYGRSKLAAEQAILAADPAFAVARSAWVYGSSGRHFPRTVLRALLREGRIEVADDEASSPTYVGDLVEGLASLAALRASGIFHVVNEGRATRYALAKEVATLAGYDPSAVVATPLADLLRREGAPARRPADSSLRNERAAALGVRLRPWQDAVAAAVPNLVRDMGARAAVARRYTE